MKASRFRLFVLATFGEKAIRALGIAESFRKDQPISTLAGVVIRSDLVIDGFGVTQLKVSGSDATTSVLKLYRSLKRNDVNAILISGSVLSLYNVLDVDSVYESLGLPVIALSFSKAASDIAAEHHRQISRKNRNGKDCFAEKARESGPAEIENRLRCLREKSRYQREYFKQIARQVHTPGSNSRTDPSSETACENNRATETKLTL